MRREDAEGGNQWLESSLAVALNRTASTSSVLTTLRSHLDQLAVHYARRALVAAFCFWPEERPVAELTTGDRLKQIMHIGLAMAPFQAAAAVADDGTVAVVDFKLRMKQLIARASKKSSSSSEATDSADAASSASSSADRYGVLVHAMLEDCASAMGSLKERAAAEKSSALIITATSTPAAVVKPFQDVMSVRLDRRQHTLLT